MSQDNSTSRRSLLGRVALVLGAAALVQPIGGVNSALAQDDKKEKKKAAKKKPAKKKEEKKEEKK